MTTRRHLRTLREIPPYPESALGICGPAIPCYAPWWVRAVRAVLRWLLEPMQAGRVPKGCDQQGRFRP